MTYWQRFFRRRAASYLFAALVVVGVFAAGAIRNGRGSAALPAADGSTRVYVFDVGQGDGILIRSETGDDILIDGGPDEHILERLAAYLPPDDHDIELMVLTHPHADHLAGLLAVLDHYTVRRFVHSGVANNSELYSALGRALRDRGIQAEVAQRGDHYRFADTDLNVLASGKQTGDLNDASVVIRLTRGDTAMLLQGDATEKVEADLLAATGTLRAAVLKVGHHGSKYSTSPAFLRAVHPDAAIISVGAHNRYGHPAPRTLGRLRAAGVRVFRTDEDGDVAVVMTGTGYTVRSLRAAGRCDKILFLCL